jgi:hypothetical protein
MSVEQYWPPEILAAVFPDEYGARGSGRETSRHVDDTHGEVHREPRSDRTPRLSACYTVQQLKEGCTVYWLGGASQPESIKKI